MTKSILFREAARDSIRNGVAQVARAARCTLGPRGRHVIFEQNGGSLQVTKDGVTVVEQIELEDPFENLGAQLVRQAASTTGERAGDGTTTATLLAEAIFVEGLKAVVAGVNPIELERGIRRAVADVTSQLREMSTPAHDKRRLRQVATVASNGDEEIGKLLSDVLSEAGDDGLVMLEEGTAASTEVHWVDGIRFDRGYLSPYFVNDAETNGVRLENAAVLICDHTLSSLRDLLPLLEQAANANRALLILASDVQGDLLAGLVVNAARGVLACCAVKAPEFGDARRESLEDVAAFVGGEAVLSDTGRDLRQVSLRELGTASTVIVTAETTTLLEGAGQRADVAARIEQIEHLTGSSTGAEQMRLQRRAAQLRGKIATIRVGGTTESEMKEKKARVDDALHAARAARAEGIVPGGGVALLRAASSATSPAEASADFAAGYRIVLEACQTPLIAIADNSGQSGKAVCGRVAENSEDFGYNAATGEFVPMLEAGIVDATSVVRQSLENAASLSATLLSSDALIVEKQQ